MSEIDQQFIEYVVKSLVGKPDAVQVDRRVDEKGVLLELTVDPEDLGRVIGKRGATAQSLRTLLRALGTKNDARYNLKIIDNGIDGKPYPSNNDGALAAASSHPAPPATDDSNNASDDTTTDDTNEAPTPETPVTQEEVTSAVETLVDEAQEAPEETSDRLAQTRRELADLDDLDI